MPARFRLTDEQMAALGECGLTYDGTVWRGDSTDRVFSVRTVAALERRGLLVLNAQVRHALPAGPLSDAAAAPC